MKNLFVIAFLALAASAQASPWSGKLGLDYASFGAIIVHDFKTQSTASGAQWDMLHVLYNGKETAEVGAFVVQRDVDRHPILGPSLGAPGGGIGAIAQNAQGLFDWAFLPVLADYGKYVHTYVNVGWDFSNIRALHVNPDLLGLGGVVKFGGAAQ